MKRRRSSRAARRSTIQTENRSAVACYARAMDHVGVLATDRVFAWRDRVILDLHFDACYFQRDKSPGHWRTGPIGVTDPRGSLVYEAPDGRRGSSVDGGGGRLATSSDPADHVVVRGAMAHLHVVSVHPFRDGNGRISRIVQSLVLALDGILSPEFASIEEYLGTHTPSTTPFAGGTGWAAISLNGTPLEWVRFCIDAHLSQARTAT